MKKNEVVALALEILKLDERRTDLYEKFENDLSEIDKKRDKLYEELLILSGNRGDEILRKIQNSMLVVKA